MEKRILELEAALLTAICALKTISFQGLTSVKDIADNALKSVEPVRFK